MLRSPNPTTTPFDNTPSHLENMQLHCKRWGLHAALNRDADGGTYKILYVAPRLFSQSPGVTIQSHKLRSENWVILSGTAEIYLKSQAEHDQLFPGSVIDKEQLSATFVQHNQGSSIDIPVGHVHAFRNQGFNQWMIILEKQIPQLGTECREDDIVRIIGPYGESVKELTELRELSPNTLLPSPVLIQIPGKTPFMLEVTGDIRQPKLVQKEFASKETFATLASCSIFSSNRAPSPSVPSEDGTSAKTPLLNRM